MDKKLMLKQAAGVLREQSKELKELREKVAVAAKAEAIARQLIDHDELLADEVLSKLSELRTKTLEELTLMEKAAELFKSSNIHVGFGKLSEQHDNHSSNPLLEYLLSET
jgi:hypothetical protein